MRSDSLSLSQARRLALGAQGLAGARPRSRIDVRHVRREIRRLGLLQLDFVTVVGPAHYQVLFSRLGPYELTRLDDVVYDRREFAEHWAHEASIVPVESWPLLRYRREAHRVRPHGFERFLSANAAYVERVMSAVRERGPLAAAEVPAPPETTELRHSWFRSAARAVLEAFFGRGRLAVADRRSNYARVYDLTERVLPAAALTREVDEASARRALLLDAARAQGAASLGDLADYYRMKVGSARPRVAELVEEGALRVVEIEGWDEPAYLHPEARLPRSADAVALLSPFDPAVWYRPRAARLFGFDYRLELFVPERKRRWGAYVLPFLMGERLVARVDLKAIRVRRRLCVRGAWSEPHAQPGPVAEALAAELRAMADWLGLDTVTVDRRGDLAGPLTAALRTGDPGR